MALELLCVRYLWDEADFLWITQRAPDEERFLSCSLNFFWPDTGLRGAETAQLDPSSAIPALEGIFDQMVIATRVVSSRAQFADDRFDAWLSYSNFDRAWKAVSTIHQLLNSRGFGLRQWSRDLFIPRQPMTHLVRAARLHFPSRCDACTTTHDFIQPRSPKSPRAWRGSARSGRPARTAKALGPAIMRELLD